jgi:hypothetical protein
LIKKHLFHIKLKLKNNFGVQARLFPVKFILWCTGLFLKLTFIKEADTKRGDNIKFIRIGITIQNQVKVANEQALANLLIIIGASPFRTINRKD